MRSIFANLPVVDVGVSRSFTPVRFADSVNGDVADASRTTEVLLALSADSRDEVDRLVSTAIATGGKPWKPEQDHGFMNGGSFTDPDDHIAGQG